MKKILIIGGGIAGLECARTLVENNYSEFILLERNIKIIRRNSWKTFEQTVKKFDLDDCIASRVSKIYQRTIDIDSSKVINHSYKNLNAMILDSEKIYEKLLQNVKSHVKTNSEVIKIEEDKRGYSIYTKNHRYKADIIIDASCIEYLTENLLENKEFDTNAFYMC